jgi:hypothetical protein
MMNERLSVVHHSSLTIDQDCIAPSAGTFHTAASQKITTPLRQRTEKREIHEFKQF